MPLADREHPSGMLLWTYSIPGAGKTMLAAALMKVLKEMTGKDCLYAAWEEGDLSIPHWVPYQLWRPGGVDALDDALELPQTFAAGDYSGLVVDTTSTMGAKLLASCTDKNLTDGKATQRVAAKTAAGAVVKVSTRMDYQAAGLAFEKFCSSLSPEMRKGKHVLMCSHERMATVEDANGTVIDQVGGPEVVGSAMTRNAPKLPHVIGRIKVVRSPNGSAQWIFQTAVDGLWISKDRLRVLPPAGVDLYVDPRACSNPEDYEKKIIAKGESLWRSVFAARERKVA